jgi:hypothetical protein
MREIAAYCEAREQLTITGDRSDNALRLSLKSTLNVSRYGSSEVTIVVPVSSMPRTATIWLANGQPSPATVRAESGRQLQLVLNVPAKATRVELTF